MSNTFNFLLILWSFFYIYFNFVFFFLYVFVLMNFIILMLLDVKTERLDIFGSRFMDQITNLKTSLSAVANYGKWAFHYYRARFCKNS